MAEMQTDTYYLLGNLLRFLASSEQTGGRYSLVESLTAPGAGAPPNRHAADDEAFYILDGRFAFSLGDSTREAGAGEFVQVPNGAVHAFRNVGSAPGRLLIINTPGHVHNGFFREAAKPMPPETRDLPLPSGDAPDIPRLVEIATRHGIEFLLPEGAS